MIFTLGKMYDMYFSNLDCIVLVPESTEARESLFSKLSLLYGLWLRGTAFSIHLRCSRSAIVPSIGIHYYRSQQVYYYHLNCIGIQSQRISNRGSYQKMKRLVLTWLGRGPVKI